MKAKSAEINKKQQPYAMVCNVCIISCPKSQKNKVVLSSIIVLCCVRKPVNPLHKWSVCVWLSSAAICEVHYPPNEPAQDTAVFVCGDSLKSVG